MCVPGQKAGADQALLIMNRISMKTSLSPSSVKVWGHPQPSASEPRQLAACARICGGTRGVAAALTLLQAPALRRRPGHQQEADDQEVRFHGARVLVRGGAADGPTAGAANRLHRVLQTLATDAL